MASARKQKAKRGERYAGRELRERVEAHCRHELAVVLGREWNDRFDGQHVAFFQQQEKLEKLGRDAIAKTKAARKALARFYEAFDAARATRYGDGPSGGGALLFAAAALVKAREQLSGLPDIFAFNLKKLSDWETRSCVIEVWDRKHMAPIGRSGFSVKELAMISILCGFWPSGIPKKQHMTVSQVMEKEATAIRNARKRLQGARAKLPPIRP